MPDVSLTLSHGVMLPTEYGTVPIQYSSEGASLVDAAKREKCWKTVATNLVVVLAPPVPSWAVPIVEAFKDKLTFDALTPHFDKLRSALTDQNGSNDEEERPGRFRCPPRNTFEEFVKAPKDSLALLLNSDTVLILDAVNAFLLDVDWQPLIDANRNLKRPFKLWRNDKVNEKAPTSKAWQAILVATVENIKAALQETKLACAEAAGKVSPQAELDFALTAAQARDKVTLRWLQKVVGQINEDHRKTTRARATLLAHPMAAPTIHTASDAVRKHLDKFKVSPGTHVASCRESLLLEGLLLVQSKSPLAPTGGTEVSKAEDGIVYSLPRLTSGPPPAPPPAPSGSDAEDEDAGDDGVHAPAPAPAGPPQAGAAPQPAPLPVRQWRESTGNLVATPPWVKHDMQVNVAREVQIECGLLRPMVQPRNKRKAQAPPPMAAINALQVAHLAKRQALHDIDFGSQDSEA